MFHATKTRLSSEIKSVGYFGPFILERGREVMKRETIALEKLKSLWNNFKSLNKKSCLPVLFHTVRLSYSNAVLRLVGPGLVLQTTNRIVDAERLGSLEETRREDALCKKLVGRGKGKCVIWTSYCVSDPMVFTRGVNWNIGYDLSSLLASFNWMKSNL